MAGLTEVTGFRGELLGPEDAGYDEARRLWNGAIDKRPALIARCTGAADVRAGIEHARAGGLPLAVRGGGHNVAGTASCDGGLVLDLSPMKEVRVDPGGRSAWAQAGLLWGELDQATQRSGLATTGGIVTHTGVAGLTLGGGIGWLMRKHGLTCDNLLAVELVTADGRLVRVDADTEPELFWGYAAAAETSAWSPPSSSASTRWGATCWPGRSCTRPSRRTRCCAATGTGPPTRTTR